MLSLSRGRWHLSTKGLYLPPYFLLKIVDIWKTLYMLLVSTLYGESYLSTKRVGHTVDKRQTLQRVLMEYIQFIHSSFSILMAKPTHFHQIQRTTSQRCTIASTSICRQISSPPKLCKRYKKSLHPSTVIE